MGYTEETVHGWFETYKEHLNIPIHWDGPSEEFKEHVTTMFKRNDRALYLETIPRLLYETKLYPAAKDTDDVNTEALAVAIHGLKKSLTSSAAESSLDFDEGQLAAWKAYVTGEHECKVETMPELSKNVLTYQEKAGPPGWIKVCEFIAAANK